MKALLVAVVLVTITSAADAAPLPVQLNRVRVVAVGAPGFTSAISPAAVAQAGQSSSQTQAGRTGAAMTNADVLALVKAGLGDVVVIAKVGQAPSVAFKLESDDLISLKSAGASSEVIAAMIKRSVAPVDAQAQARANISAAYAASRPQVKLQLATGDLQLQSIAGDFSSTYAYVTTLQFMNYPGLRSETRVTDRQLSIVVSSPEKPTGRFFIVKTDPDTKNGVRSVKIGRGGFLSIGGGMAPDSDWTVAYDITPVGDSLWKLTPKKPLKPGEYGVYTQTRDLFDFAVE